jgi:RNA polymerase sigma factor (sigma-70 family)
MGAVEAGEGSGRDAVGGRPGGVEDRALAARLAAGDESSLAQIYERHAGLVFGVARRVLADASLAEDVTQEVFVFLWEHPERFDPTRGTLRAWLGLLAHRRSVDRVRAEVRRSRGEDRAGVSVGSAGTGAPGGAVDAHTDIDDALTLEWWAGRVRHALDQLPAEQRDAVVLAYYGGRSYRQVATELSIPEGTAKSRLRLALAKLDELLRPTMSGQESPAWT